jgi:transketolase
MGLEDIAMFRSVLTSTVLHPCDATSTERLVEAAAAHQGIVYLRTMRQATPVIYDSDEKFPVGGSKVPFDALMAALAERRRAILENGIPRQTVEAGSLVVANEPGVQPFIA